MKANHRFWPEIQIKSTSHIEYWQKALNFLLKGSVLDHYFNSGLGSKLSGKSYSLCLRFSKVQITLTIQELDQDSFSV